MNQTFVCCTSYHLYISILESFKYREQGNKCFLIFITDKIKNAEDLIPVLERLKVFDLILPIKSYAITDNMLKRMGLFNFIFRRSAALVTVFEKHNPILIDYFSALNQTEFNLFMTNRSRAYFIIKYPKAFMRIHEDGLASYSKQISSVKVFIRKYVLRFPILKGYDDQVKEFWVQYPEKVEDKILRTKMKRLDLEGIEDSLNEDEKESVIKAFLSETRFLDFKNRALIITQPFSEIGMMTESEKINIYKAFIAQARKENLHVFLKAHPSERTDYHHVFGDEVSILPGIFPLEIFNLSSKFHFQTAYTVHSSSLVNLKYVDNKVFSNTQDLNPYH